MKHRQQQIMLKTTVIGNLFKYNKMIHIAFAPDNNYVMPTAVALTSLLMNEKNSLTIHILYIENELSPNNQEILRNLCNKYGQAIEFKQIRKKDIAMFPKFRHGLSSYLRILSPQLFPNIDKLLYLDGDLIIEKSISELYNTDISSYQYAAVSDLKPYFTPGYIESIGFIATHPYINAGVMLMNLQELRRINVIKRTKKYLEKYKDLIYHEDQDILNCVCPDVLILPPKYNSIIHLWNKNICICRKLWTEEQINEAKVHPVIVHYLGGFKPWKLEVYHPLKKRWIWYLHQSPFKSYKAPFSIKKVLSYIKAFFLFHYY